MAGLRALFGNASFALIAAGGVYLVSGYAVSVALARTLGTADFGRFAIAAGILTLAGTVLARGAPVVASKQIAAHPEQAAAILARVTRSALVGGIVLTALLALAAPLVAYILGDEELLVPLLVGAPTALGFSLYGLIMVAPIGLHRGTAQAVAQVLYSIARLVLVPAGALVAGVAGAVVAAAIAPVTVFPAAWRSIQDARRARTGAAAHLAISLRANSAVMATTATVSLLLIADLLAFSVVGGEHEVGVYAAAATLAHVPFFLVSALQTLVMPRIAAADPTRRAAVTRRQLGEAYVLLAIPTIALVVVGDPLLPLIFGAQYEHATPLVAPLAIGTAGLTIHALLVAVDTAYGRLRTTFALSAVALIGLTLAVAVAGDRAGATAAALAAANVLVSLAIVHSLLNAFRAR